MTIELEMGALPAATYNTDLAEVGSLACAAWRDQDKHPEMLELRNGSGQLLDLIPADTEPQTAAIACRLYAAGCVEACETGTASAWTSRRSPIGAAAEPISKIVTIQRGKGDPCPRFELGSVSFVPISTE